MRYLYIFLIFFTACKPLRKTISSSQIPYHLLQNEKDLDVLLKEIGNASIVLLGEESHGTHEYFLWRTAITKRLIQEKGFKLVAVEGDWEDFQKLNKLIHEQGKDSNAIKSVLDGFHRWPEWMWNNRETLTFVEWIINYNQNNPGALNLFGVDLYSFWSWTNNLAKLNDTALRQAAQHVRECFAPYDSDAIKYARAAEKEKANCSATTKHFYEMVDSKRLNGEHSFYLQQMAMLSLYGEKYFRTLPSNKVEAWNLRERYMVETIKALIHQYASDKKIIIWLHNTHVGDDRFVDRSTAGYTSVGEILRKEIGDNKIFSVGFGSYKGTVTASYYWNDEARKINLQAAKQGSWEDVLHRLNSNDKILISKEIKNNPVANKWIEFRSVGVVNDEWTIYNRSIIPRRFDAFIYLDSTSTLHLF